jgi:hypothetical protein
MKLRALLRGDFSSYRMGDLEYALQIYHKEKAELEERLEGIEEELKVGGHSGMSRVSANARSWRINRRMTEVDKILESINSELVERILDV